MNLSQNIYSSTSVAITQPRLCHQVETCNPFVLPAASFPCRGMYTMPDTPLTGNRYDVPVGGCDVRGKCPSTLLPDNGLQLCSKNSRTSFKRLDC